MSPFGGTLIWVRRQGERSPGAWYQLVSYGARRPCGPYRLPCWPRSARLARTAAPATVASASGRRSHPLLATPLLATPLLATPLLATPLLATPGGGGQSRYSTSSAAPPVT